MNEAQSLFIEERPGKSLLKVDPSGKYRPLSIRDYEPRMNILSVEACSLLRLREDFIIG